MTLRDTRRVFWMFALAALPISTASTTARAGLGAKRADPAQVVPLGQIDAKHRESVAEVIRDATFHRQGAAESFPCDAKIYLSLLNEPALTLTLWQDLSPTPAKLKQLGPTRYQGTDGAGATATWDLVFRSPRQNIMICDLEYVGPRGHAKLTGRIVLIVRSGYFREVNGDFWVQHDVEAFVKIDSKGWKAVAKTVRPIIEKLLEDQVQEAGWFVSMMGRLVMMYPNWATQVCDKPSEVPAEVRKAFRDLIVSTRKPGAFPGRPILADATKQPPTRR